MNRKSTLKLVYAALCLALALVLPFLTGQIPQIGQMLSPMHIPVFLCGFLCGWPYGLVVGFIAPLLRSVLFSMPVMYPGAVAMAFELATYGLVSGLLYKLLPKKPVNVYITLVTAMICGRIVWGIARLFMAIGTPDGFTFAAFIAGAVTNAIPGIILHLVLVPVIVLVLKKANLVLNE